MRPTFAQETFYFTEEFNQERTPGALDPDKWIVYPNKRTTPNNLGCLIDTVRETTGLLILNQCSSTAQYPYIVSKNDPFPSADFTTTVRFQFPGSGVRPTGVRFVDKAPENGGSETELFGIGFEEDSFQNFTIKYQGSVVYTKGRDSGFYIFKATKQGNIYKLYLNDQLVFTSPETSEKVHAIYIGNPSIYPAANSDWSLLRIDYIRITNDGSPTTTVQPFLDLPWNYNGNNMSFNEAATSINAFFDHEYPVLSTRLGEPTETAAKVISYRGGNRTAELDYSSHDGYDYGNKAQTKLNTSVLAAGDGEATYMNSCGACGNAILIDHKNGYQTRYYHMQPDGLITNNPGQKVTVVKGQQIGKVGFSGNVIPKGENGSHLHFMVVQDKNNDGDFADNIPDGITDPFGWQSTEADPWETYSFNYAGKARTGNKSYYLFTKKLDNLNSTLTSNAAVFEVGKAKLEFPQGATNEDLNIKADTAPNFADNLLNSLGSILKVEAKNTAGQAVTTFLKNFSLTLSFSQFDLTRYNLNTLSIYSSPDGQNWTKENTQVDLNNKTASTSINHLTYFALMAERKDTIAPTTTPVLEGEKGTGNNYRSDVKVNLNTIDNPNGLGIEFTAYAIGDGDWQTYASPLNFSEEGNYKISFYSQDKDENIENVKVVEFSIDKTIPEAKIEVDQTSWDLKVSAIANDQVEITKKPRTKANEFTYTLKDPAGNTLILETYHLNSQYIDLFKLFSLKYNANPVAPVPENILDTNYIFYTPKTRPEIKVINQNFTLKDKATFVIVADAIKNKTVLNILENKKLRKEEKPGIVLLKLQTNKGRLEYVY